MIEINERTALIDTDFLVHVSEIEWDYKTKVQTINGVFNELQINVAVHPLVYKNEILPCNKTIEGFFNDGLVSRPMFEDFFGSNDEQRDYYAFVVQELHSRITGSRDLLVGQDIFTFWKKKCSLGEVHSIALCITCGCGMFLSDDKDSKDIANKAHDYCPDTLKIYNRNDVMDKLGDKKHEIFENRSKRKAFVHK